MENKDLFKKACLIQLSTPTWGGSKGLEERIMEKIGNTEYLKGKKFLIAPEMLGPIHTAVHQARNTVLKYSLPFPLTGISLVPRESIALIDERLEGFRERFWLRVAEFEEHYEAAREEARKALGDLYNDADYPADISRRFNFTWRYFTIDTPGKSTLLSPEIYEREKEKFISLMEETKELAMVTLREEFSVIVKDLTEKLTGTNPQKTIKASMCSRLREFLDDISHKNVFEDEVLMGLAKQARSAIDGVSPYGIKYNSRMQEQLKSEMANLSDAIGSALEDLPRRKIRMVV